MDSGVLPWPTSLPALALPSPANPCRFFFFFLSGRWLFLFQYWKEQTVDISFECIQVRPGLQGTACCKLGLPLDLRVSVAAGFHLS